MKYLVTFVLLFTSVLANAGWYDDYLQLTAEVKRRDLNLEVGESSINNDLTVGLLGVSFGDHIDSVVERFGKPHKINEIYNGNIQLFFGASNFEINASGIVVGISVHNINAKKLTLTNGFAFGMSKEEVQQVFSKYTPKESPGNTVKYIDGRYTYSINVFQGKAIAVSTTNY